MLIYQIIEEHQEETSHGVVFLRHQKLGVTVIQIPLTCSHEHALFTMLWR